MKQRLKENTCLAVFCGVLCGFAGYVILLFLDPEGALAAAFFGAAIFTLLLWIFLFFCRRSMDKKYAKEEMSLGASFEAAFPCKINGNFDLGREVRNGNVYFGKAGVLLLSLDKKPHIRMHIPAAQIDRLECDDMHMRIYTKDEKTLLIKSADVRQTMRMLMDMGMLAQ